MKKLIILLFFLLLPAVFAQDKVGDTTSAGAETIKRIGTYWDSDYRPMPVEYMNRMSQFTRFDTTVAVDTTSATLGSILGDATNPKLYGLYIQNQHPGRLVYFGDDTLTQSSVLSYLSTFKDFVGGFYYMDDVWLKADSASTNISVLIFKEE